MIQASLTISLVTIPQINSEIFKIPTYFIRNISSYLHLVKIFNQAGDCWCLNSAIHLQNLNTFKLSMFIKYQRGTGLVWRFGLRDR
jgi:hypothetical protein